MSAAVFFLVKVGSYMGLFSLLGYLVGFRLALVQRSRFEPWGRCLLWAWLPFALGIAILVVGRFVFAYFEPWAFAFGWGWGQR